MLKNFVEDFAKSMEIIDKTLPPAVNVKTKKPYQRGIGPYQEKLLVKHVTDDMKIRNPHLWSNITLEENYPNERYKSCDVVVNKNFFIEIKAIRKMRDNGTQEEFLVNHILSPYENDKSFLTDTKKLLNSDFEGEKAVVFYGYDYEVAPMDIIVGCYELIAEKYFCKFKETYEHSFDGLVHPIHQRGKVKGYLLEQ
ncbi:hypothetical protein OA966_00130 [Alphaproteobacteria bacterium]|nr:hypothetical protein [Alphaproteobacteria bacterium]